MSQNLFNTVQYTKPKRNTFDLTHDIKTSFNMGELVPVCVTECIPGDKFHISCQALLRFAPLIAPVMHRINAFIHYFFVPHRITWQNWKYWITGEVVPSTALPATYPTVTTTAANTVSGSLSDYLGIPLDPGSNHEVISALPFAAYQAIYNEYYRDENLVGTAGIGVWTPWFINGLSDGDQGGFTTNICRKKIRAWEHDYFTAALPFAQKGAAVSLPLGKVIVDPTLSGPQYTFFRNGLASPYAPLPGTPLSAAAVSGAVQNSGAGFFDPNGTLTVNPTTINDLRRAYRLQEWLEKNARGGTRYIEHLRMHFGVQSSDKRLQRPEYITGMKMPVIVSEIVNTGGDQATLPQGNMSGHALSAGAGKVGSYYCEEHGYIIGIMSVMPKTAYQQGIPRHFLKGQLGNQTNNGNFDYFWPEFANIGEQPVQNNEIYAYQISGTGQAAFGYVPRYAEYKFEPSRVSGDFRGTLSYWHLGRIFGAAPVLNQTFIECVPTTSIFAVTDPAAQKLYAHVLNQIRVSRLMPKFGTPHM